MLRWTPVITLALLLGGCFRLGFDAEPDDAPAHDAALDTGPAPDSSPPPDGAPPDLKPPLDHKPVPESTPPSDLKLPPDGKPGLPDTGIPTTVPCRSGFVASTTYGPKMVHCKSASSGFSQCGAHIFCNQNEGWHVCNVTEFVAYGGLAKPPSEKAWIKGHVRSATGALHKPQNGYPPCLSNQTASASPVAWYCVKGNTAFTTTEFNLGICAHPDCQAIGVKAAVNEGYWSPHPVMSSLSGAVCCY